MLDIKFIKENLEEVKASIEKRRMKVDIDRLLELYEQKLGPMKEIEELRSERNKKSKTKPSEEQIAKMKQVGEQIKKLEEEIAKTDQEYQELLMSVPNLIHTNAPVGEEKDFSVISEHGAIPEFSFEAKEHEELMINLDLLDFERGAKVAGSKSYFYKNDMVRLSQALLNYGIDVVSKHGFTLLETPDFAKEEILEASGFNPRGEESQIYKIEGDDLNLIGTAEITVLGYHANEVLDLSDGPKKYAALSHCFRKESGAYGKANKGMYRVHQFTKLEMFIFCKPEDSEKLHEELLEVEKEICDGLGLAYRVIDTPSGDLGAPAYRKYDLEAWMKMKDGYGEITSTSNCLDFQARRLGIRHKNKEGKNELVHTLNGTAMVLSRFPVAIVEQYQQEDGSVEIPEVLIGYMGKGFIK